MHSEFSVTPLNVRPLMRIENVTLEFPVRSRKDAAVRAIDDVSLDIAPGEIIGLVGESGSGKTTLGKTCSECTRQAPVISGTKGLTSQRQLKLHRRDLQLVFQDPLSSFNPRFRIGDSIALPLRLHGICRGKDLETEVRKLLERVGLSGDQARRFPHELSGGQLQRVAIARVLGIRPKLIVADEAVSKLDVSVRDPKHPYTRRLLEARHAGPGDDIADDAPVPALALGSIDRAAGCNYRDRCPVRLSRCDAERPGLQGPFNEAVCLLQPAWRSGHRHSAARGGTLESFCSD
jgi:ABC-type dipeptide/oligopeptide/nickel transport system ATPase component